VSEDRLRRTFVLPSVSGYTLGAALNTSLNYVDDRKLAKLLLLRRAACRFALGQGDEAEAGYEYD